MKLTIDCLDSLHLEYTIYLIYHSDRIQMTLNSATATRTPHDLPRKHVARSDVFHVLIVSLHPFSLFENHICIARA